MALLDWCAIERLDPPLKKKWMLWKSGSTCLLWRRFEPLLGVVTVVASQIWWCSLTFCAFRYIEENYSKIRDVERELASLSMEMKLTAGPKKAGEWVSCVLTAGGAIVLPSMCFLFCAFAASLFFSLMRTVLPAFVHLLSTWTSEKEDWSVDWENSSCEAEGRRNAQGLLLFSYYLWPCSYQFLGLPSWCF